MKIEKFELGPVGTNCYIVSNEQKGECFVVDVGGSSPEFISHLKKPGLTVKAVLLTHGHFDHIMGLDSFLKEFPVPVYAWEGEKELIADPQLNSSLSMLGKRYAFDKAQFVKDGEVLEIAGMKILVIATPGHTAGGCCYYMEEEQVLFSGDTLFRASIGRTDLPTGSMSSLVRSVEERLFVLPDETKVYPGHMEETSIGYEKKYNPFFG